MIALWLASSALALDTDVEICFEFQIDFDDVQWGDYWLSNATNRKGRGVEYVVTDATVSWVGNMSQADGCVDLTVTTFGPTHNIQIEAKSTAEVSGIEIESYLWSTPTSAAGTLPRCVTSTSTLVLGAGSRLMMGTCSTTPTRRRSSG